MTGPFGWLPHKQLVRTRTLDRVVILGYPCAYSLFPHDAQPGEGRSNDLASLFCLFKYARFFLPAGMVEHVCFPAVFRGLLRQVEERYTACLE